MISGDAKNGESGWGDDSHTDASSPAGIPKWLLALPLVFAVLLAALLAAPWPKPVKPPSTDPLGLITVADAAHDAPQRVFGERRVEPGWFVGVDACRECHRERVESYQRTHHFLSSRKADAQSIAGPRNRDGAAHSPTPNENLHFDIESKQDRFWQTAVVHHEGRNYRHSEPFDIVIGSGLHAQSYLYWRDTRLYQLPLSYSRELDAWTKNPGFPAGVAIYSRAASSGCLRCHATYLEELDDAWNSYQRASTILGISCERCHGAGKPHLDYRRGGGESLDEDPIVRPQTLSRERQLDICAQCHAGVGRFHRPPFSYQPGEPLAEFIEQEALEDQAFGVHTTNQLARLRKSRCFGGPEGAMTCVTCHDPHQAADPPEHSPIPHLQLASQKCLQCHQTSACPKHAQWGDRIASNCIDCHMPTAYDQSTDLATRDDVTFPQMRDHFIARYPKLTMQVESRWREETAPPTEPEQEP